ncbi:MAG: GntR family transcriptional regulator [Chloroflexi bacterium]|nr:GntR family transcriptional regulator [Chloroflexota bacterium]
MNLRVDLQSDIPIYSQIVEQVERGLAAGHLQPGQQLPTVRALAGQLDVNPGTVARAYSELERLGIIATHRGGGSFIAARGDEAGLGAIREGRLWTIVGKAALEALSLGYTPPEIEAAFALHMARWRVEREKGEPGAVIARFAEKQNTIILTGSHDLALDLLASHLRRRYPHITLSVSNVGSLGGLIALEREEAHVAGAHLLDEETGEYNLPFVKRLLPGQEVVLLTLFHRVQGLMLPPGNPKRVRGLDDLRGGGVRFVNRQKGAGTRVLLDYRLKLLGIQAGEVLGYEREEQTHLAVAAAVASGAADAGLGILAAARSFGLEFLPLVKERYDLVVPRRHYDSLLFSSLATVIGDGEFRQVVESLGGYDVSEMGRIRSVG